MESLAIQYYPDESSILSSIDDLIKETEIILDVGCGIVPINYFRPKLHIMVEPWKEYADILSCRHGDDKSVLIIKLGALEALSALQTRSIDSIFLIDVIEHLDKDTGLKVIEEIERVARQQAVIFTPLGFMPQHVESEEKDAWGLSGGEMQEHKSGWLPNDFGSGWQFHVCESYHSRKIDGEASDEVYGAFFAIQNFNEKAPVLTHNIPDIRRPLPSELALEKANAEISSLNSEKTILALELEKANAEISSLNSEKTIIEDKLKQIDCNIFFRFMKKFM